jgi:hypothetical protein
VFLKLHSGVWTNHSLLPNARHSAGEHEEDTEQEQTSAGSLSQRKGAKTMQVLYQRCAGIDVHLRFLVVCLSIVEAGQRRKEVRSFRNETADLLALRAWLLQEGCTHVGMESTGVYWLQVYRRLEGFFELVVANAQHIKAVPGHKTDVQDAEWIADLLQHGLLNASFVPNREQQELRDLTRLRISLVQERARLVNRVQKILEEAGIKWSLVLSDVLGKSGRAILEALCAGENDPQRLAQRMHQNCQARKPGSGSSAHWRHARTPSLCVTRTAQPHRRSRSLHQASRTGD